MQFFSGLYTPQMEKLSIGSKYGENGQEKCPSEHSEETELCSCKLSELDLCSSVTDSSCFANVIEKLLDQQKSEKDELKAEKQQLANKLECEKARADQTEQAIVELNKKVAVLEEEKHKFGEEKKKQKNMNTFISSNDYHIYSKYVQLINYHPIKIHQRYLAISDDQRWLYISSEPTLFSRFKMQQNFDGTFGIYSTFKGKFLENNGQNGFGLTDDGTANNAKFEFQYVGEDYDNGNRKVMVRSMGGNGYLRLEQLDQQIYDFHVTINSASKDATVFTLVPAYDLSALLKK